MVIWEKMILYRFVVLIALSALIMTQSGAGEMIIDDRSTGTLQSSHAGEWRLITDRVMGGRSSGELILDQRQGRYCLHMRGAVSTANSGGFVQIALDLAAGDSFNASDYAGLVIAVMGNGERYNLHLRTSQLWLPWQSYRSSFVAASEWREIRLPFNRFEPYKTGKDLDTAKLVRIGVVAIGREFDADLCVGSLAFYE